MLTLNLSLLVAVDQFLYVELFDANVCLPIIQTLGRYEFSLSIFWMIFVPI